MLDRSIDLRYNVKMTCLDSLVPAGHLLRKKDTEEHHSHGVTGNRVIYDLNDADNGKMDPTKLNAFVFDQFQSGYYAIGKRLTRRGAAVRV